MKGWGYMETIKACCSVNRQQLAIEKSVKEIAIQENNNPELSIATNTSFNTSSFVTIASGTFWMGSDAIEGFVKDGEGPARQVYVDSYQISKYTVTNEEFALFVQATNYITEAEQFGWSYVFSPFVLEQNNAEIVGSPHGLSWWSAVNGAYWAAPEGPNSSWENRKNHPAVHISWNDAAAYCQWMGGRLPTEAEWEYAARGGLEKRRYPWGDELHPDKKHMCNIWQGKFPHKNHGSDGYIGTAPVDAYEPNGYGLHQTSGNVWEWCHDYFDAQYHTLTANKNPVWNEPAMNRSMRGGSYLCHRDYCNRYRVAARTSNSPDSSSGHCGFRVVIDI